MRRKKIATLLIGIAAAAAATFALASPASAQGVTNNCGVSADAGQCVFWGQNYNDSHSYAYDNISDFDSLLYLSGDSSTPGFGTVIKNNNGSDINDSTACQLDLWSGINYSGDLKILAPYGESGHAASGSGLGLLLNSLESQEFFC